MDIKIVAIVAVTLVAVSALGVGGYYLTKEEKNTEMDFSILDDPAGSLKNGLNITTDNGYHSTKTSVAMAIIGVQYSHNVELDVKSYNAGTPSDYDLVYAVPFDYTKADEAPEGITVVHNGNDYIINGTGVKSIEFFGITLTFSMTYTDFTITLTDKVDAINGYANVSAKAPTIIGNIEKISLALEGTFGTHDGKISIDHYRFTYYKMALNETKANFVAKYFITFDEDKYSGCTITDGEDEKVYGKECKVKVLNGTHKGVEYKDYKIFTYKGFIVKESGTLDDKQSETVYKYYYK